MPQFVTSPLGSCMKFNPESNGDYFGGTGQIASTTTGYFTSQFPVTMRIAPTALEQSGTASDYQIRYLETSATLSAVPAFFKSHPDFSQFSFTVSSGLTAGQACSTRKNASGGYLAWSAEL